MYKEVGKLVEAVVVVEGEVGLEDFGEGVGSFLGVLCPKAT